MRQTLQHLHSSSTFLFRFIWFSCFVVITHNTFHSCFELCYFVCVCVCVVVLIDGINWLVVDDVFSIIVEIVVMWFVILVPKKEWFWNTFQRKRNNAFVWLVSINSREKIWTNNQKHASLRITTLRC
jgi:NADH:ubiquinone oxidoreductase subunit 6 (subunit J)